MKYRQTIAFETLLNAYDQIVVKNQTPSHIDLMAAAVQFHVLSAQIKHRFELQALCLVCLAFVDNQQQLLAMIKVFGFKEKKLCLALKTFLYLATEEKVFLPQEEEPRLFCLCFFKPTLKEFDTLKQAFDKMYIKSFHQQSWFDNFLMQMVWALCVQKQQKLFFEKSVF